MKRISSARAKACEIPTKVKNKVWERDNHCSIFSGNPYAFPECHYIPRQHGGLGIEQNIFTATREEHDKHDHGTPEEREYYHRKAREYFQKIYPDWNEEDLYYKKYGGMI